MDEASRNDSTRWTLEGECVGRGRSGRLGASRAIVAKLESSLCPVNVLICFIF